MSASAPLGASWDGGGTHFSLFSASARSVDLLLFDEPGGNPRERVPLERERGYVWHTYLPGAGPGELYDYSVDGPYAPGQGHRFNRNKALLDPYAKAVADPGVWDDSLFGYRIGDHAEDLSFDERDSSSFSPKGVVVDQSFDWGEDTPPRTPWDETVIYELHVKGFTKLRADLDEGVRGTYAGLASGPVTGYLRDLGVTAVELLPVHHHVDNRFLHERRLTNYWGYNSVGYFAPDSRYSSSGFRGQQVREFKSMVKALHSAGVEVLLDVVYNHTAEGNQLGPTLSFRGIDNLAYYRLVRGDLRHYFDVTGTGNSLNMRNPFVVKLIMDSLRYWVTEMHVDGFRFDLAPALARERYQVSFFSPFYQAVHQDPTLSRVKLIAEPWDLGHGGHQVGNFPPPWAEWNDLYRDTVRRYWKGEPHLLSQLATRLAGSSDLYSKRGRGPLSGVNFVTCHDGFTLADLVSYNQKHNEANGEGNRDGSQNNFSWNCGHEGQSDDPPVVELRRRQMKNFMATLLLSQGVPMLLAGDERGRTQRGNNNAYCQDSAVSWVDWTDTPGRSSLHEFVRRTISIRKGHPVFRRRRFFRGGGSGGPKDVTWLKKDGTEIRPEEWNALDGLVLGMSLSGEASEGGTEATDNSFVLVLNGSQAEEGFTLPDGGSGWELVLDTSGRVQTPVGPGPRASIPLGPNSLVLLRRLAPPREGATFPA